MQMTPTHRHQGTRFPGLAVHAGAACTAPVTEIPEWSESRLQKADFSVYQLK